MYARCSRKQAQNNFQKHEISPSSWRIWTFRIGRLIRRMSYEVSPRGRGPHDFALAAWQPSAGPRCAWGRNETTRALRSILFRGLRFVLQIHCAASHEDSKFGFSASFPIVYDLSTSICVHWCVHENYSNEKVHRESC